MSHVAHNHDSSGRCAIHRQRSRAASHAALAERPESQSASICRIHVCRGLPRGRRYCRLLSGLRPVRVSTARRGAVWAGTCSLEVERRMWPNTAMRRSSSHPGNDGVFSSVIQNCSVSDKVIPVYSKDSYTINSFLKTV